MDTSHIVDRHIEDMRWRKENLQFDNPHSHKNTHALGSTHLMCCSDGDPESCWAMGSQPLPESPRPCIRKTVAEQVLRV